MHTALSAALKQDELFALYQPQLASDGVQVVCAEALLRWRRPGMGLVQPDDFVQFAEHNALIDELGTFMLERACEAAAVWGDLPVSINVSPLQFMRADLDAFILDIARRAGLPMTRLEIELTETAAFTDLTAARLTINRLRAQGVIVTLDDLGSGYATTCLMRDLPLDRVKLDKSMVDLAATAAGAEAVAKIVGQARELGLKVTAEGIETPEQFACLREFGFDRVQGFLFARPMSATELSVFAGLTVV